MRKKKDSQRERERAREKARERPKNPPDLDEGTEFVDLCVGHDDKLAAVERVHDGARQLGV